MTKNKFIETLENYTTYYIGSYFVPKDKKQSFLDYVKTINTTDLELTDKDIRTITTKGSNHLIFNNKIWLHFNGNTNTFDMLPNNIIVYMQEFTDSPKINFIFYYVKTLDKSQLM